MSNRRQKNRQPRGQTRDAPSGTSTLLTPREVKSTGVESAGPTESGWRKIIAGVDWFLAQPMWFLSMLALGIFLRLYFVFFTQGTYDVEIWQGHAQRISEVGLIRYYHENPLANHPPFISEIIAIILRFAERTGIPFRVLLRLPFCLIDAGTVILLLRILRQSRRQLLIAAAYWLNPLAILYSSYHGNTDSAVAFFILLSVWFLSENRGLAGALALGAGMWIKLPVVLAVPGLLLLVNGWRKKLDFFVLAGVTGLATYLPALLIDPQVVWANVFNYRGQFLHTTAGIPIWGWLTALVSIFGPADWLRRNLQLILVLVGHGTPIALGLIPIVVWRRRWQRSPSEVLATIAVSYVFVYAFSENWAFQYFAWSLPFWFFLPAWFPVLASLLAGAYIYSLYAYDCGNLFLRGKWDFIGHPYWPQVVIVFRDLTVLFFVGSAGWFLIATAFSPQLISCAETSLPNDRSVRARLAARNRRLRQPTS
jgi:hypothetical protein